VFAGVAAGLAMWTKNSTLALLPSLVCLVVTRPYARTGQVFGRWLWRDLAAVLTPIAVVAGPWYLRNQSVFGFLIPPTIWTDSARHTPGALAAMLQSDQHFGISGWVFTAGIVYGLARLSRGHRDAGRWYVLLVFLMPFAAAWWWAASYESRFLVTMLPIVGAMGALMLADAAAVSVDRLPARGLRVASLAALVILSAATLVALRKTVEHKSVLVRTLWPDDAARHRVRVGGLFGLAAALNALPEASRVGGVPAMARLYLDRRRFTTLDFAPRREPPHLLVHDYDYVVYRQRPGEPLLFEAAAPIFRTADGYLLVATSVPVQTSARPSGDRR
jgi:hypothetical protein